MPYVLGVDIGNSFTTAATAQSSDNNHLSAAHRVKLGLLGDAVPSVAFVADNGSLLVGEAAEQAGTERPDRVVRSFRERIGDTVPMAFGKAQVTAEHVFATMARWVVDRATEVEGTPPDAISLTHPADWGGHRVGRVRRSLAGVGLRDVTLVTESEAAAANHAKWQPEGIDGTIAVYDLGGSSFSVSLVRMNASG